jgi:hypothetical protein
MIRKGDCHWHDLPLPGEASTAPHCAFVLSADDANDNSGYVLLASSHRGAKHPWAFFLVGPAHYRHSASSSRPPFDTARPIGVEQMVAVPTADLTSPRDGALSIQALDGRGCVSGFGADSAMRVQFALPGYQDDLRLLGWRPENLKSHATRTDVPQHSVWEFVDGQGTTRRGVVISNDKHNTYADHVQVLELDQPVGGEFHAALSSASPVTLRMTMTLRRGAPASSGSRLVSNVAQLAPGDVAAVEGLLERGLALL